MEKQLKSIKFPGLDDVYVIPEGGAGAVDIDLLGSAEGGVKPQSPLQHTESGDYFYPLTTMDQVIMEDGSRLNDCNFLTVDNGDSIEGEVVPVNADTLGGHKAEDFVKKSDAMVVTKNYCVVGGTEVPENPTENMIWVQTDVEIGNVYFSGIAPSNCIDNDIWISTNSGASTIAFDSIRIGNDTMNTVYPISAKQYVGGTWVDKTVKSWQNSEWVDWWGGELFNNGNQYNVITGGWVQADYTLAPSGDTARGGSLSIGASIVLKANELGNCVSIRTAKKIDLTGWSTLKCDGIVTMNSSRLLLVANGTNGSAGDMSKIPASGNSTTLDISHLTGEYYIGSYARQGGTNTLNRIWLER